MPSCYAITIPVLIRGMKNASGILTFAETYAKENNMSAQELLDGRLYTDMGALYFQVHRFTDHATFMPYRVAGVERLQLPDTEKTFDELRERIAKVLAWLGTVKESDFEGKEGVEVVINPQGPNGTSLEIKFNAVDYLTNYAMPQFWFHVTVMYGILRSKGVPVGKLHFLNASGEIKAEVVKD